MMIPRCMCFAMYAHTRSLIHPLSTNKRVCRGYTFDRDYSENEEVALRGGGGGVG